MKVKNTHSPRKRSSVWSSFRFLAKEAAACKHGELPYVCILWAVLSVAINIAELFLAPVILGKISNHAPVSELLSAVGVFIITLLLLRAGKVIAVNVFYYGEAPLQYHLRESISNKHLTTSYPNAEDTELRELYNKANASVQMGGSNGERAFWVSATELLIAVLSFGLCFMLLANLHPVLMVVIVASAVVSLWLNQRIMAYYAAHRGEELTVLNRMFYLRQQEQNLEPAKDIRLFGLQNWLEDLYAASYQLFHHIQHRQEFNLLWLDVVEVLATFLRQGVAYVVLIHLVLHEGLPAPEFLLYFNAASSFATYVNGILTRFSELRKNHEELVFLQRFLELPEPFLLEGGKPLPEGSAHEWCLQDVSFRYPGAEEDTLHHINLRIRPGEKIAVVGLNGAGKTTLVKLLSGLYDPTEGAVLLDGQDIRQFNRNEYYRLFAAVLQEHSLLDATIAENITTSLEDRDEEKLRYCVEQSGLSKLIKRLPKGMETNLGRRIHDDGLVLSGGETQRLLLARALYQGGSFLLLDEPTAALDPLAEHEIYLKYTEMCRDKSAIFISHRLASTRFCDEILFMQDGRITERGTHDALLKRGGDYAKLFAVQAQYYQEGGEKDA